MIKHDYQSIDEKINYKYREDRKEIAQKFGYKYISEATVEMYRKYRSTRKVSAILKVTSSAVLDELKRIGEPLQGRGGYHKGDRRSGGKRLAHVGKKTYLAP